MDAKIVILNWNGLPLLERFLESVAASAPSGVGIVVADNGSTDGSTDWVADRFAGRVQVVRMDSNRGFAGGYNLALSQLKAECFVLLNSDVECPKGWCEPLLDYLERNPRTAAVQPKILSLADRSRFEYAGASGGFIDSLGYPFCRGRILSTVEHDCGQYDDARKVFWASGACFAVRADAFRRAGGFDDDFFAHMEEIDLCWRLQLLGYDIAVEPASCVYHLGGGTLPASSPQKVYYNFRNSLYMLHKNLPDSKFGLLRRRMRLDRLSAAVYRATGRKALADGVKRAHRDYLAAREQLDRKRACVQSTAIAEPDAVYCGSILWRYLFRRKFSKMM